MNRRLAVVLSSSAAIILGLAACSSSGKKGSSATGGSAASGGSSATSAPGGTGSGSGGAASGTPLKIYFVNEQGSTTGASYPQETSGAQAAVSYVNSKLGGVAGHPLQLQTCFTDATPASATTCANKAVAANPFVFSVGTTAVDESLISVIGKTGIPYISNYGASSAVLTAKGKSFVLSSYGDAADAAFALLMKRNGVKKVAEVYVNVPTVVSGLLPLTKKVLTKAGISASYYPVPYPSSDLTPTISAINSTNADAIHFQADPITCAAGLNAIKSLGFSKPIYAGSSCITPANGKLVAQLHQPVYSQRTALPATANDPDVTALKAAFGAAKLTDKLDDQWALDGFTDIMNIYSAMKATAAKGQLTRESLTATLQSDNTHQFLLGSATFRCDGTVLPDLPALCSLWTLLGQWKGGTSLESYEPFDGAQALK
jgi:branched-chain amino acid transport system substrate-binding protein